MRTVAPARVTMLDQSPHQLARARRKRALDGGRRSSSATPRRCPSPPTRATATSRRAASSTGPIPSARSPRPTASCARAASRCSPGRCAARTRWRARLSDAWMLFPAEDEYVAWFERAGFEGIERVHVAPALVGRGLGPLRRRDRGRQAARRRAAAAAARPPPAEERPRARRRRAWRASPPARSPARRSSRSRCGSRSCASSRVSFVRGGELRAGVERFDRGTARR